MIMKKTLSLAASIISFVIIQLFFFTNSNSEENNTKYYAKDNGILSIMYHRFNENKYPSTNVKMDIFQKHIKIIKPKLLVFVGSIAAKNLLKSKEGITKIRGKKHIYEDKENDLKIEARAIFHPAYLMRNPIEKKHAWEDLKKIYKVIKKKRISLDG